MLLKQYFLLIFSMYHQQPQYRQQVLGMQQQLPRTQQGNPQQPAQQFDDVTSFDFLN